MQHAPIDARGVGSGAPGTDGHAVLRSAAVGVTENSGGDDSGCDAHGGSGSSRGEPTYEDMTSANVPAGPAAIADQR